MRWASLKVTIAFIVASLLCGQTHAGNSSATSGQEIYDAYCGACHGFNGVPLLPNTPDFSAGERLDKSASALLASLQAGKGKTMPAWLGILSGAECEAVLQFIRETLS